MNALGKSPAITYPCNNRGRKNFASTTLNEESVRKNFLSTPHLQNALTEIKMPTPYL